MKPPSSRVERDHPRSPPHVATNGARKRSKLLRLATGRLPENFGVLRTSPLRSSPKLRHLCSFRYNKRNRSGGKRARERRSGMSSEENKALARRSWEAVDNPDLIDEVYASDVVWHEPDRDIHGTQEAKQFISLYVCNASSCARCSSICCAASRRRCSTSICWIWNNKPMPRSTNGTTSNSSQFRTVMPRKPHRESFCCSWLSMRLDFFGSTDFPRAAYDSGRHHSRQR